jgi:hypothetical protein
MKTHKECQIEKVISREPNRPVLHLPYFRGGALWASNGKALVRLPVEEQEGDTEGWVPVSALKEARKLAKQSFFASVHVNGAATLENGTAFPRPDRETMKGEWPNCERILEHERAKETRFFVTIDPHELAAIASAMGADSVRLEMTDELTPVRVFPAGKCPVATAQGLLAVIRST